MQAYVDNIYIIICACVCWNFSGSRVGRKDLLFFLCRTAVAGLLCRTAVARKDLLFLLCRTAVAGLPPRRCERYQPEGGILQFVGDG
jgi:hypothetical protein